MTLAEEFEVSAKELREMAGQWRSGMLLRYPVTVEAAADLLDRAAELARAQEQIVVRKM